MNPTIPLLAESSATCDKPLTIGPEESLMSRLSAVTLAAAAVSLLAPAAALADETAEVCVLTSVETLTAPKKPNIFETILDCGGEPDEAQSRAAILVNNAMNEADALEVMVDLGYEVETGTTWTSYTGREILGRYVLVLNTASEGAAPKAAPAPAAPPVPVAPIDELPEAEDAADGSMSDEGLDDFEDMGDDDDL